VDAVSVMLIVARPVLAVAVSVPADYGFDARLRGRAGDSDRLICVLKHDLV
jgi:hypothetical protein